MPVGGGQAPALPDLWVISGLRVTGIEPVFHAWEARVLPLNHTRVNGRCNVNKTGRFWENKSNSD